MSGEEAILQKALLDETSKAGDVKDVWLGGPGIAKATGLDVCLWLF